MQKSPVIVLISANAEWRSAKEILSPTRVETSPYGEWFSIQATHHSSRKEILYFHGGWGKIAAAGSCQYAIDQWKPKILINLGTCGGFAGRIERNTIILVERTVVYDIDEQMGDHAEHIAHYSTQLDLGWLEAAFPRKDYPIPVVCGLLVSGDRDLSPGDIPDLINRYGAFAGDWESGAIAFVASRNHIPCLILRGVSDLVDFRGGEAYGNLIIFENAAKQIMKILIHSLPDWLDRIMA